MRIAIDATPLTCETGGIRRYVVELTRALAELQPGDQIFLLSDQDGWQVPEALLDHANIQAPRPSQQRFRSKWWSLGLPWALARHRIDVFHGTDFAVPYLPLRPSVLTVHDLSPWKKPPLGAAGARRIRERTPCLLRLATMVVTPTQAVKREVADHFQAPPTKIAVTPLAAHHDCRAVAGTDVTSWLRRKGVQQPYLAALAAPQRRKNVALLIEAWQAARKICPNLQLVCVGHFDGDTMKQYRLAGVGIMPALADRELQTLLSGAVAFVYPSLYEGFGLPVLEAMRIGTPVITSQDAAISEVAGSAALQVDVTSKELLSQSLVEVVTNPRLQADLKAKGIQRSSQFSWRATALLTRRIYVEAIRRF